MTHKFLLIPFLFGLILSEKLYLVGELYVGEIIAVLYLVLNCKRLRLTDAERLIIVFALLWAFAQLISDLLNESEIVDSVKGIFAPILFSSTFIFILNYIKNKFQRLPSLLVGTTIGELFHLLLFPTEYFLGNFWKWGLGSAVLSTFVIYFSFFIRVKSTVLLLISLTLFFIVSLYFNARGLAALPLMAAILYTMYYGKSKSIWIKRFSGKWSGIKLAIVCLPALFLISLGVSSLFSADYFLSRFPSDVAAKYRIQASGAYGIFLGGRAEILASGQAFLSKPLLGHGSWAKDKSGYLDEYSVLKQKLGYSAREDGGYEDNSPDALIPTHSYLMGSLVWSGVFGGLFWLIALNTTLRVFLKNLNQFPFYFYYGIIAFTWSVFFSPFGATARWASAVFLAALFSYSNFLKFNNQARR